MNPAWVFDASALLAWALREPGFERAARALAMGAAVSAVNWAETLSKLADVNQVPEDSVSEFERRGVFLTLAIHPFDADAALDIARLRPSTRAAGLSLGDRACLALARSLKLPVLTADRAWTKVHVGVKIETIR